MHINVVMSAKEQYNQGLRTELPGDDEYSSHMSFFFDRVPLGLIAGKYPNDHPAWAPGRVLWVSTINATDFHPEVQFTVVETPSLTKLADASYGKISDEEYLRREAVIHQKEHTKGSGLYGKYGLLSMLNRFKGTTRYYYQQLLARPDFSELTHYYAATVPHLMIKDPQGSVRVTHSSRIIVPRDR